MSELIQLILDSEEKNDFRSLLSDLRQQKNSYLLRNDILNAYSEYCSKYKKTEDFCSTSNLSKLIYFTQEIIREESSFCFIIRPKIALQEVYRLTEDLNIEEMTVKELLNVRDRFVNKYNPQEGDLLELDFAPFYDYSPQIRDPKNIGKGVQFLNRYLSSKLFADSKQWLESLFDFLRLHQYNGVQVGKWGGAYSWLWIDLSTPSLRGENSQ